MLTDLFKTIAELCEPEYERFVDQGEARMIVRVPTAGVDGFAIPEEWLVTGLTPVDGTVYVDYYKVREWAQKDGVSWSSTRKSSVPWRS